jgi:hypothetical protein
MNLLNYVFEKLFSYKTSLIQAYLVFEVQKVVQNCKTYIVFEKFHLKFYLLTLQKY